MSTPQTTEHHIALREAHSIESSDSYFKHRAHLDDEHSRYMFERGFERGFNAGEKVYRPVASDDPAPTSEPGLPRAIERMKAQVQWLRHGKLFENCPNMAVDDMEAMLAAFDNPAIFAGFKRDEGPTADAATGTGNTQGTEP